MSRSLPRRHFRWRLTIAFMLVAAISSGILALASYMTVRSFRLRDTAERNVRRTESNLVLASTILGETPSDQDIADLLELYGRIGGFAALVDYRGLYPTDEAFSSHTEIPDEVRTVRSSGVFHAYTTIDQDLYLVSGGRVGSGPRIFFFFRERGLQRSIDQLGQVLLISWIGVVIAAGSAGILVARRVLRPVAQASAAARSLAEGLLDTRLPVERTDEFGIWAMSFNEMAQALQEKIGQLEEARNRERRFTADVAHELRTPVSALVSEASLLKESLDDVPAEARRPAEMIVDDIARLGELIRDLLEIAQLDAGRDPVEHQPVEVASLIERLVDRRGWTDRIELDCHRVTVESDRRRLERILGNLLDNAVKHGGETIRGRVRRSDGRCVIDVSDSGPGIPPDQLPRLFDRFYKADSSRASSGSGLGLSIALENARIIGATLSADSTPGEGTTFRVELPIRNSDPEETPKVTVTRS